ncbi:MAG: Trm112 family protein [Henriciella sp.]|nr:Trm112 family protein [Hyphomonadaceae bacterium]
MTSTSSEPLTHPCGVSPRLLEVLICPVTGGPLSFDREACELVSKKAKLAFPIRDGLPILLESEARDLELPAS